MGQDVSTVMILVREDLFRSFLGTMESLRMMASTIQQPQTLDILHDRVRRPEGTRRSVVQTDPLSP